MNRRRVAMILGVLAILGCGANLPAGDNPVEEAQARKILMARLFELNVGGWKKTAPGRVPSGFDGERNLVAEIGNCHSLSELRVLARITHEPLGDDVLRETKIVASQAWAVRDAFAAIATSPLCIVDLNQVVRHVVIGRNRLFPSVKFYKKTRVLRVGYVSGVTLESPRGSVVHGNTIVSKLNYIRRLFRRRLHQGGRGVEK